jgi:flotillin
MEPNVIIFLAVIAAFAVIAVMIAVGRLLLIAQPNEVIILSGRKRTLAGGETVGYRMIRGGRAVRIPLLEKASRMSLETIPIELSVTNAYSKGGIPLKVEAIANIKVDSTEPTFGNAVERFLNRSVQDIHTIAKDTLEGNLRGVLASLTPEEVNEDRMKFAENLIDEALNDLRQLGLKLDTLKITNISDEKSYLDSIGRKISAEVIASARKAEAEKKAEAEEAEAEGLRRAAVAKAISNQNIQAAEIESNRSVAVAKAKAEQEVEIQKNLLRIKKAELEREAIIKEKEALVAGQKAQVMYEQEVEEQRIILQKKRLTADVIEPANAHKQAAELEAKGAAASIIENGNAQVEVIKLMIQAYQSANGNGDRVFMLNMLPQITGILANTVKNLNIEKISVIDPGANAGNGNNLARLINQLPSAVVSLAETIENATGVDIFSQLRKAKASEVIDSFSPKEIKEIKDTIIKEEIKDSMTRDEKTGMPPADSIMGI